MYMRDTDQTQTKALQEGMAAGKAAMTLCESILLFLIEKRLADADDIISLVEDAASLHQEEARENSTDAAIQHLAAGLIERIASGRNIS